MLFACCCNGGQQFFGLRLCRVHRNITACLLLTVRIAGAGDGSTASRNTLGIDGQRISSIRADLVSLSAVLIGIQGHTASRAPLHLPVRGIVGFDGRSESDAAAHVDGLRRIGVECYARDGDGGILRYVNIWISVPIKHILITAQNLAVWSSGEMINVVFI